MFWGMAVDPFESINKHLHTCNVGSDYWHNTVRARWHHMQASKPLQAQLSILSAPQLSVKCGSRFSRKARIPSFWSSRAKQDQNSRLHASKLVHHLHTSIRQQDHATEPHFAEHHYHAGTKKRKS